MAYRRVWLGGLAWCAWWLGGSAWGQGVPLASASTPTMVRGRSAPEVVAPRLRLEEIPPAWRERTRRVIEQPTLCARGPMETFNCQCETYHWLIDHPDRAADMWRHLGAQVANIQPNGPGRFVWRDDQGSEVQWSTIVRTPERRIWYAEGVLKAGLLVPSISVRAILVLHILEGHTGSGRPAIRHHTELLLQIDSRAAALATRLLGTSAPRMAEQYLQQIEMFFAGLSWYLDENPERAQRLVESTTRK